MTPSSSSARLALTTGAALAAFAANSLLCRAALSSGASSAGAIDAWSFTALRLGSGALMLAALARMGGASPRGAGSFGSALALWGYAAAFSLAYLRIGAAVGALVLFASVQATMIGWSALRGARPSVRELRGLAVAFAGLLVLTVPGASLPDPFGLALMALAGMAWGAYSLRGGSARAPLLVTADNFARSLPLALGALLAALAFTSLHANLSGILLACTSGALTSGLGYALWYQVLPRLGAVRAALVQLLVPALAGLASFVLLGEHPSTRLLVATPLILGGVGFAVLGRARR